MKRFQVRVTEKEFRPKHKIWVSLDTYHIVVEAETKQRAYKSVRKEYDDLSKYGLGRVSPTTKQVGKHLIPFAELRWSLDGQAPNGGLDTDILDY